MSLANIFQKTKWEKLAKKDANYYVFSDKEISNNEQDYRQSGRDDVERLILKDKLLEDFLKDVQEKTCFEFGCGNGRMTEFLAEVFSKVYALDISEEMLGQAKVRLAKLGNIAFLQGNGQKIDLPDRAVDFVFSYIVLRHLPSKKMVAGALDEFYRILKKGGLAKLQVRGRPALGGFLKWYWGVCFKEQEILELLKEIGFSVIHKEGQGTKLFWLWLKK